MDESYNSLEDINITSRNRKSVADISISETLGAFERMRISALTKAAAISPLVKEVTIGPKSPLVKKEIYKEDITSEKENRTNNTSTLIEEKVSDELRHTLIMKEYEQEINERSEELFRNLVERMIAKRRETMDKFWKKQSEDCERKTIELRSRKLQMLKELQANDNVSVLERARLDQEQCQLVNSQTIENMNRILEEQNQATARFASITDSHTKICICYNEITGLIQTEPLAQSVCDKYITAINTVIGNITKVMDVCKSGTLTDKDVKQAELLVLNIDNIRKKVIEELNEEKQREQVKKQEEELARKREEAEKIAAESKEAEIKEAVNVNPIPTDRNKRNPPLFYSQNNYKHFEELRTFLEQYENQFKELLENVNYKKFRFDCQKAVNTPVNALSSVSGLHIMDKFNKLAKLLLGERVQVLDMYVTATQHPQGLAYVTALLAKKIVRQGDLLVSSNPEAAFPLAALTVALWALYPVFGKLVEANFQRLCPYIVPMLLPQKEGQTDKEFYLSRGYTYNDEGVVEKQDKFLKRMSGIFRLQCAIWIAKTPRAVHSANPHGVSQGWKWLASFINLKPEPDISATLLHEFFTICGSEFLKIYGKQFIKIIKLINTDYFAILQNIDEGGPKTRLEVFLQNVLKTGHIPPPAGLLPPNTW